VAYDRLLVTTGGRNRTLSVPGADLDGVFQLRTVEDCDRIRAVVRRGRRAVVMGLGFIGSEVSASLRQLGVEVAAVEGARVPLARVVGEEVGQVLTGIHREKGVELILEDSVAAFEGSARVERVRTKKGRVVECEMVVAGIGIVPNTELLGAAGAQVDNGVLVDERCRTSVPDVFAAGDVTNHLHPIFGRLRVEHWNNGYQQGRAAARSLAGGDQPYDYIHSFWSDQYEHTIEYVGFCGQLGPSRVSWPAGEAQVPGLLPEGLDPPRGGQPRPRRRSRGPQGGGGAEGGRGADPQPRGGRSRQAQR
jgi:3-phenylpropionate/trans-cinnamate dioxygenase ferredoxin reductase subunit